MNEKLLLYKYKPIKVSDYSFDKHYINKYEVCKELMLTECVHLLLIGSSSSGKTSFLETLILEYYGNIDKNFSIFIRRIRLPGIILSTSAEVI